MKNLHNVSTQELIKSLKILGYEITRQTGSHIRLTSHLLGEHHVTIPNHNPLKVGTLAAIIADIATHHKVSKVDIIIKIF
jgi:predicted RNA binding protein YcfA (HicA-like mRNA interferase family)